LLADQPAGQFALTDLALTIAFPRSYQTETEAKKQAFLRIEQFAFLFNQHKGKLLPMDEFLRNIMEQECGIPREFSQEWVNQFRTGARTAGLLHNRGDGKIQITESPVASVEIAAPPPQTSEQVEVRIDGDGSHGSLGRHLGLPPPELLAASGHCTRIDLSDGRRAEISIPDRLTAKDAQKLQKALEGIGFIIQSMVSE
jgi:hypothetical protein